MDEKIVTIVLNGTELSMALAPLLLCGYLVLSYVVMFIWLVADVCLHGEENMTIGSRGMCFGLAPIWMVLLIAAGSVALPIMGLGKLITGSAWLVSLVFKRS